MEHSSFNPQATKDNNRRSDQTGSAGVVITPPAYGIESLDLAANQTTPLQMKTDSSSRGRDVGSAPPNHTGLPNALKSGIESLSGLALDDVHVHYNSPKPAQLEALAYTQGTEIHVAPGQERHLPHEAWHVVQQKQGRVQPTLQMKAGVSINDDQGLEHEADLMGAKARQAQMIGSPAAQQKSTGHANGCGCASCTGSKQATRQMVFNPSSENKTIQRKYCNACGKDPCICLNNRKGQRAPTGRYKNTTGHHDPTIDKSRKKSVKTSYTGKRGKRR